jgi:thiamine-phosphate pyrophosphorylase
MQAAEAGEARRAALGRARLMVIVPGLEAGREALAGGAPILQLRAKAARRRELWQAALALAARCREAGALLIVNDHVDVAVAAGADGAHGGADDLPPEAARLVLGPTRLLGATAHGAEEAARAAAAGADYVGIGTIFESGTKPGLAARGPDLLRAVLPRLGSARGYAIGGITRARVREVLATGVHGVAVAAAIVEANDIARETARFLEEIAASGRG